MDIVGKAGKGNGSKLKGKAIILKGPLLAAEVYWMLWVPPGLCEAPAAQHRRDRLPFTSRWIGNGIQCDDRSAL